MSRPEELEMMAAGISDGTLIGKELMILATICENVAQIKRDIQEIDRSEMQFRTAWTAEVARIDRKANRLTKIYSKTESLKALLNQED